METKNKNALIGGLLAVVFVMAVGYAAFATTLNINGTANITSSWDVHIKSITAVNGGTGRDESAANNITTEVTDNDTVEFTANLLAPGDSVTYTIEVENGGSLGAKLESITAQESIDNGVTWEDGLKVADDKYTGIVTPSSEGKEEVTKMVAEPIIYTHSISDLSALTLAPSGDTNGDNVKSFTVTVTYNSQVTDQPLVDKNKAGNNHTNKKLKLTLNYVQNA